MQMIPQLLAFLLACTFLFSALPVCAEEKEVFTQQMIDRSLTAVGNTERIHHAIEKARQGEEVSIVYLGGSITEGANAQPQRTKCFAYLSAQLFAEKFMADQKQLKYHNAGISGTPSLLGVTRCEQDVLRHEPDIVFVEFAVNDGTDTNSRMAYESLVCKLLESPSQPAVILIFTLLENGYSAQSHMQQIGSHYDLGMVSIFDAVNPQIKLGKMTWRDYSSDGSHPHTAGHAFVADCIGHYFDAAAAAAPAPYTMPEKTRYGKPLATLVNLKKNDPAIVSEGSFPYGPVSCYSYRQGWRHLAARGGADPLVLELTTSHMTIAFKQERNTACGKAEVWVDGKRKLTLNGYADNAWGNVVTEFLFLGARKPHTIEIRMAEGDEGKTFNLLDVGYVP